MPALKPETHVQDEHGARASRAGLSVPGASTTALAVVHTLAVRLVRGARAEAIEPDDRAVKPDVPFPHETHTGLDGDTGRSAC